MNALEQTINSDANYLYPDVINFDKHRFLIDSAIQCAVKLNDKKLSNRDKQFVLKSTVSNGLHYGIAPFKLKEMVDEFSNELNEN